MIAAYMVSIGVLVVLLVAVIVIKVHDARQVVHLTKEEKGRGLEQEREQREEQP